LHINSSTFKEFDMKRIIYTFSIIIFLVISVAILSGCYSTSGTTGNQYSEPVWTPAYIPGARYYYFPDIETYYDVRGHNFVYLDRGEWIASDYLPQRYRDYDLYNGYKVILDRRVYDPWRFHRNYVTSYPPYYYHWMYDNSNVAGFNENTGKPVYDRTRRNDATGPRRESDTRSSGDGQSSVTDRRIGKPVQVTPEMRRSESMKPPKANSRTQSRSTGIGTGTSNGDVQQRRSSSTSRRSDRDVKERQKQQDTGTESKSEREERRSNPRR
jgi:hypothetical protein